MVEISSSKNQKIKEIYSLYDKKERNQRKEFLVEGHHLIDEALKANQLCYIVTNNKIDFEKYVVDGYFVSSDIIKKVSSTINTQGIVGVVKMKQFNKADMISIIKKNKKFIILDNINDPGNLGTIIRTAASLGVDAVFVSEETVDMYNEKVIRATQGAIFKIPVIRCDLKEVIGELKENGVCIYGTSLNAKVSLNEVTKKDKLALVFGNEANGVREEIQRLVDENFLIPMKNNVESLNVAIACAICVYALM